MTLRLPFRLAELLRSQARSSFPLECCGALVGRYGEGWNRVERLIPLPNVAASAERRYEMDPAGLLSLHRRSQDEGLEILGYYHSHPEGRPAPSETDRAAAWPNLSYLITSIDSEGLGSMKSWRLVGDRFVEEDLALEVDQG